MFSAHTNSLLRVHYRTHCDSRPGIGPQAETAFLPARYSPDDAYRPFHRSLNRPPAAVLDRCGDGGFVPEVDLRPQLSAVAYFSQLRNAGGSHCRDPEPSWPIERAYRTPVASYKRMSILPSRTCACSDRLGPAAHRPHETDRPAAGRRYRSGQALTILASKGMP